jgi:hypothetical protein
MAALFKGAHARGDVEFGRAGPGQQQRSLADL